MRFWISDVHPNFKAARPGKYEDAPKMLPELEITWEGGQTDRLPMYGLKYYARTGKIYPWINFYAIDKFAAWLNDFPDHFFAIYTPETFTINDLLDIYEMYEGIPIRRTSNG